MNYRDNPETDTTGVGVRVLLPDGGQMEPPEGEGEASEEEDAESEEAPTGEDGESAESEAEESEGEDAEAEEEAVEDIDEEEAVEEVDEDESDEAEGSEEGEAGEGEEEEAEEAEEGEAEEGEEEETEREKAVSEEGSRILHLNLDGLFLDLLGLEVDLDTVTLNLTAIPGESKLLGNLLSAVSGLLGGDPLSNLLPDNPLGGLLPDGLFGGGGEGDEQGEGESEGSGIGSMLPDVHPLQRARKLASSMADAIRGAFEEAGSSIIAALPLEELLAQFLQSMVDQLLEASDDGGESQAEEAAPSA